MIEQTTKVRYGFLTLSVFVGGLVIVSVSEIGGLKNFLEFAGRYQLAWYLFACLLAYVLIVAFVLTILYIVHAIRSPSLSRFMKITWIGILLLGCGLSLPVYYYFCIWRNSVNLKPRT